MNDTKATLLASLPLLFIIVSLVAALIILPQSNQDIRDKAAEPKPTLSVRPTTKPELSPNIQLQAETACTGLYNPVCGTDNQTYASICEANQAGVQVAYNTACTTSLRVTPTPTPTTTELPSAY